jgi:hypothetical protein
LFTCVNDSVMDDALAAVAARLLTVPGAVEPLGGGVELAAVTVSTALPDFVL